MDLKTLIALAKTGKAYSARKHEDSLFVCVKKSVSPTEFADGVDVYKVSVKTLKVENVGFLNYAFGDYSSARIYGEKINDIAKVLEQFK